MGEGRRVTHQTLGSFHHPLIRLPQNLAKLALLFLVGATAGTEIVVQAFRAVVHEMHHRRVVVDLGVLRNLVRSGGQSRGRG